MVEKRWIHAEVFNHDAIRLVTEEGYGVSEAAHYLGIKAHRSGHGKCACDTQAGAVYPGNGRMASDQAV